MKGACSEVCGPAFPLVLSGKRCWIFHPPSVTAQARLHPPVRNGRAARSSIGQAQTHPDAHALLILLALSALRDGCCQGSGGTEAGFCVPTALGAPPGSLPARSPSQLRTTTRGQGGVGECRARRPGRVHFFSSVAAAWGRPSPRTPGRPVVGFSFPLPSVISCWALSLVSASLPAGAVGLRSL